MSDNYNGWKNRQTWNVALWVNNDESIYNSARLFAKREVMNGDSPKYNDWLKPSDITPDGVSWTDQDLDYPALDEMMKELASE